MVLGRLSAPRWRVPLDVLPSFFLLLIFKTAFFSGKHSSSAIVVVTFSFPILLIRLRRLCGERCSNLVSHSYLCRQRLQICAPRMNSRPPRKSVWILNSRRWGNDVSGRNGRSKTFGLLEVAPIPTTRQIPNGARHHHQRLSHRARKIRSFPPDTPPHSTPLDHDQSAHITLLESHHHSLGTTIPVQPIQYAYRMYITARTEHSAQSVPTISTQDAYKMNMTACTEHL